MAVLKVPRISTIQRLGLILDEAEVVFDTDEKKYYGGDGIRIGGFPLGEGLPYVELREVTNSEVSNKSIMLSNSVSNPDRLTFHFLNGTTQLLDVDYEVIGGNIIEWNGKGLDGFIEAGDKVRIEYF